MTDFSGSCLCGKVQYQIEGEATGFYHCHCSRCRKLSGTGHASNIRIKTDGINWLSGEQLLKSYKVPEAERFRNDFCSECGSPLPRYFPNHGFVTLPAGTLDHEIEIKPQARIFFESGASWSCNGDGIPTFKEYVE